jgi:hypothetical protein
MNLSHAAILQALYAAVDATNEQELADPIVKSPSTKLWGPQSVLDSLGLVSFLAAVEHEVTAQTGNRLKIFDSKAMRKGSNPYDSIESLAAYIGDLLSSAGAGGQVTQHASAW